MKYKNPIIKGSQPDPSICRAGDDYFLVTSSFEYLPAVPLFYSSDLVNWEHIGHCLTRDSQIDLSNCPCSAGICAPTIRYHDGTFYMITTNVSPKVFSKGNFIVTAKDPFGEWSDPIWVKRTGIDPSLYWEDGRTYMQLSSRDELGGVIEQFEINIETGEILDDVKVISRGCGGRDVEAPHMYKINDYYFLMVAEGGTREGHMVTIMRSKSLWGPFEPCPYNPILSNRDYGSEELQSVGHGDLFQDRDSNWWMVALATRPVKHRHVLGRETILMPVSWSEDGWPVVKDRRALSEVETDLIDSQLYDNVQMIMDDFNESKLAPCYTTMREFITDKYSLTDRQGWLCLKGDKWSLNDTEATAFIGRRQEEYNFITETVIDFSPEECNEEAGLVLYMDNEHHMDLVVTVRDEKKVVLIRKNVADIKTEMVGMTISQEKKEIYLRILGDKQHYHFFCGAKNEPMQSVGSTKIKHLSTECANSAFTGVLIGMYASGNGKDMHSIAYFDYLKIENVN